jgi:nicotinate phosphoribosyltransferase
MDIVEIEGQPKAKRGKMSGSKRVFRCGRCQKHESVPFYRKKWKCSCGGTPEEILVPVMEEGRLLGKLPRPKAVRGFVLEQLDRLPAPSAAMNPS